MDDEACGGKAFLEKLTTTLREVPGAESVLDGDLKASL
jgi:hypothetical protein